MVSTCEIRVLEPVDPATPKGKHTWEWKIGSREGQITVCKRYALNWAGSHFHTGKDPSKNPEYFLLISGIIELECIDIAGNHTVTVHSAYGGPIEIIIPPMVLHRMKIVSDCCFIEYRITQFNKENPDTLSASEFPIKTDWE